MKIIHVVGNRPQFIKLLPVFNGFQQIETITNMVVHSGQHYDYQMSQIFFDQLALPSPDYQLGVGSAPHGAQTGEMMIRLEIILEKERPDVVIVYGDTNTTLAGALAAAKMNIPVAHAEAGLRSYNRGLPEEINRVLTDHASVLSFCPSEVAVGNLVREGLTNVVEDGRLVDLDIIPQLRTCANSVVINTGDLMYDTLLLSLEASHGVPEVLEPLNLERQPYYLATVHRPGNTDDPKRLRDIFMALVQLSQDVPVIVPLHPRTRAALNCLDDGFYCPGSGQPAHHHQLVFSKPLGYLDMIWLENNARAIITDSGGMQKEAFWLGVPCVTLRNETEWPETVTAGANVLVGSSIEAITQGAAGLHTAKPRAWKDSSRVFGDGKAAQRIVAVLRGAYGG